MNKKTNTKNKVTSKNLIKTRLKKNKKTNNSLILDATDKKYLSIHKSLKLQIELVPQSCWFSNTRKNLRKSHWDSIRRYHYEKANNRCEICGGKGKSHPVECHEVWIYNDKTFVQKLGYFQAICPLCHEVKHIGLAGILGNGIRAFKRFKRLNNLDIVTAKHIIDAVFKQWKIRSHYKWELNIVHLKKYGIDIRELKSKSKQKIYFRV